MRRRVIWTAIGGYLGVNLLMFLRFFFPRALYEPNTVFSIGYPADFALGIDQRFLMTNRVWVIREPDRIFVIFARCTHLGCTPEWKPSENKFKCPCHGSGYDCGRRQFRGAGAASDGPRAHGNRCHGQDHGGYQPACTSTIRTPASITSTIRALRKRLERGRARAALSDVAEWGKFRGKCMAEENGGNGKRPGLLDRVREDAEDIKKLVQEKGKEELDALKEPEKTQLYRSIFRVKHEDTPRSRSLGVLSNVFLAPASGQGQSRRRSATTTPGAWAASRFICSSC